MRRYAQPWLCAVRHGNGIAWYRYGNAMTGSGNVVPIKATRRQGDGARGCGAAGKCAGMAWQSDGGANRNHAAAGRTNALTCTGGAWTSNAGALLSAAGRWQSVAQHGSGNGEALRSRGQETHINAEAWQCTAMQGRGKAGRIGAKAKQSGTRRGYSPAQKDNHERGINPCRK